jgi:hypothetical protein
MKQGRAARWLAWAFALTLIGYPLAGLAAVFAGLPSWMMSYPFRLVVVGFSAWLMVRFARLQPRGRIPALLAVFWLLYVGRLLVDMASGPPGAAEALFFFALTTLIPMIVLARMAPHWDDALAARAVFLVGTAICGGGVLLGTGVIVSDRQLEITTRLFLDTVNPVTFGHVAASTLIAAAALTPYRSRKISGLLLLIGSVLALWCLVLAGSRGPILGLAVSALFIALAQRRLGLLAVLPIIGAVLVMAGVDEIVERFSALGSTEVDASVLERLVLQANAIDIFLANPLLGGAFAEFDLFSYPHNVFLETAMALGIVGLAILFTLVLRSLHQVRIRLQQGQVLLPLLFMQYFVGIQFSGSLWGSSPFWACMALLLLRHRAAKRGSSAVPKNVEAPLATASTT